MAFVEAMGDVSHTSRLLLFRLADATLTPVTNGTSRERSPTWSLDGRTLYFVSNRDGAGDLWQQQISPGGDLSGAPRAVTVGAGMRRATLCPDGSMFAYSNGRLVGNIWRVPIFEGRSATWADAEQLTFDQGWVEYLDISPDGHHIAFSSDSGGRTTIWTMTLDDGKLQRLTTQPTLDWYPRWSPDGQTLVFYSLRSGNRDIWTLSVETGETRQLTDETSMDFGPAWSADGSFVFFASVRSGNSDIWVTSSDGGEARQLTTHAAGDAYQETSPDGNWLVFASTRGGGAFRLWKMATAGGGPELVSEASLGFLRLSKDGSAVYFVGDHDYLGHLWSVSVQDGAERALTDFSGRRGALGDTALATDGKYLYFVWEENLGDIWVMDVVTE